MLSPRRTVRVVTLTDRAPVPYSDPFYKSDPEGLRHIRTGTALREHRERLKQAHPSYDTLSYSQSPRIKEARKKAVWHPHPDDSLPSWGLW